MLPTYGSSHFPDHVKIGSLSIGADLYLNMFSMEKYFHGDGVLATDHSCRIGHSTDDAAQYLVQQLKTFQLVSGVSERHPTNGPVL